MLPKTIGAAGFKRVSIWAEMIGSFVITGRDFDANIWNGTEAQLLRLPEPALLRNDADRVRHVVPGDRASFR